MLRSIGAVVAGYFAMAILIMVTMLAHLTIVLGKFPDPNGHFQPPVSYAIVNLVYSTIYAAFGGYLCAVIAKQNRLKHGVILAAILFVLSLVSVYVDRGQQPVWYQAALVLLGAPATVFGAWMRAKKNTPITSAATAG